MGVKVDYRFPAFTSDVNRGLLLETVPHIALEHGFGSVPRLVIAMIVPDRPGVLAKLLEILQTPLLVANGASDSSAVKFSVEGAITSSVGASFMVISVVRPYVIDPGDVPAREPIRVALQKALLQGFWILYEEELVNPADQIRVLDFDAREDSLFANTRLLEYRLTIDAAQKNAVGELAEAVGAIARAAGRSEVPVAYVLFPSQERTGGVEAMARVGCAIPTGESRREKLAVRLDRAAIGESISRGLRLEKYWPKLSGGESDPYFEICDFRVPSQPAENETVPLSATHAIFIVEGARTGLVGAMLADGVAENLLGGMMAVVGGHTIASWVCPAASADLVVEGIKSKLSADMSIVSKFVPAGPGGPSVLAGSFWAKWKVPDTPGVFLKVTADLRDAVREVIGPDTVIDLDYSVSRVVEGGYCVGKVRVGLAGHAIGDPGALISDLNRFLDKRDYWRDMGKRFPSSSEFQFSVQCDEPVEDPWVQLVPTINPT